MNKILIIGSLVAVIVVAMVVVAATSKQTVSTINSRGGILKDIFSFF